MTPFLKEDTRMTMMDFEILWQPIVRAQNDIAHAPHVVQAGQLQIQPARGHNLDTWWHDRVERGEDEAAQMQLEFLLSRVLGPMSRVSRWHIPLSPHTRPQTRELYPLFHPDWYQLNWVYELPVDEPLSDWVWWELDMIRQYTQRDHDRAPWPLTAGTHVGRHVPLTRDLAEQFANGPFQILLLDPSVAGGISAAFGDDETPSDSAWALHRFLAHLPSRIAVVATGVETWDQWRGLRQCGIAFGQGSLWMAPTRLSEIFGQPTHMIPTWEGPDRPWPLPNDLLIPYRLTL